MSGIWLKLVRFAGVSNFLPVKMSLLAETEGEVFGAAPKSCGCVKNCSKLLPLSTFCDVKKLTVDACESGAGMLLGVSAVLLAFRNFPDVNGLDAVNSESISNGFCSGNKTS